MSPSYQHFVLFSGGGLRHHHTFKNLKIMAKDNIYRNNDENKNIAST